ncbi:MAG: Asp-tRNA(Asn)/Glu-tRNA(Gln) amidotransferase subunit GatB [Chlamydiae bacterium]|nr:Asp-tRNA(Asn)/Glu-tRNA(Gln) amidotransferase subunit GatB [Chlamydiota bacterium]
MTDIQYDLWEPVIGLEVHVQLNTKSKLFSSAPNRFGDEPNTNITEVCTGQPGALPVLNKEAVKKAVQLGLAIQAHICPISRFDRKSYFYPDSPRNFQITQFEQPIIMGGVIIAEVDGTTHTFAVNRAHLEDDAGMLKHFSTFAGVDYNRAGVPLIEVVSEPCLRSAKEAVAYATALKAIMEYLDVSDCNMEESSLRVDANISVRLKTEKGLRNKIEIKNMNSFHNMEMAIDSEIRRQIHLYSQHPDEDPKKLLTSGTYRFNLEKKETVLMRQKEEAEDYKYFPEPDLLPIILTQEYIEQIRKELPELPHDRFKRYTTKLELSPSAASTLINDKEMCLYFEECLKDCIHAKTLCNWLLIEFVGRIKESGKTLTQIGVLPLHIANLVNMIETGTINGKIAKSVADDMLLSPEKDSKDIVRENPDYQPLDDTASIEALIDTVLAENGQSIQDFKAGKIKAFAYLIGQVMKLCKGKASPTIVNEILTKKLQ